MKKTLALVLALAMVFSTITVAFAEGTIGADAQICADLGMLKGSTGTVDAAYTATAPTRIQAAVMVLRLRGLEAEAMAFTGEANFADADKAAWAKPIMAYMKANPQLGWSGDGTNFDPMGLTTAQAYYKVMLEALGYKQTTPEVVGDFAFADTLTFAASKGLTKVAAVTNFTVNDLATATVETLKANMKDGGKTLVATLVEAGKVDKAKAVTAGLLVEAPVAPAVAVDEAFALGNAVVQVEYEDDVDAAAAGNAANYSIEGLEIKAVVVAGTDTVRLETAAMSAGTLYKLTVGEKTVTYTGVPKDSDAPVIEDTLSEDVEEVVIDFDMNVDYAAATNVANYSINGVEIAAAEVDEDEVTLTTVGLKNKTNYVVKVTNMKSIDGYTRKSDSDDFKSNLDVQAPKIDDVSVRTNHRIKVTFNEEVDQASAENLANYSVKVNETDGAAVEVVSVTWDDDDENNVTIITESMDDKEEYKLSINSIADQRKVPNVMTRASSKVMEDIPDTDEDAPEVQGDPVTLSPTTFLLTFEDDSKLDETSVLDPSNYTLEDDGAGMDIEDIVKVSHGWKTAGHYEMAILFTVEEMIDESDVELTFIDILDEFGNAIDDDVTVDVDTDLEDYASAALVSAFVRGENTVELIFDKDLDEASAETLANYTLDNGIGYPKKAEYEADGRAAYSVTLTVNDLIDDKTYDVGVENVKDLAGHTLKIVDFDTSFENGNADTAHWDDDTPDLEDIDTIDKYTLALTFDEEVNIEEGDVTLSVYGVAQPFTAMTVIDDATVLFINDDWANWAGFTTGDYTVTSVTDGVYGIQDEFINDFDFTDVDADDREFAGNDDDPDYAEVEGVNQVGGTFEVTMSANVLATAGTIVAYDRDPSYANPVALGTFAISTDDEMVYLDGTIEEDEEYHFDLSSVLTDELGMPVVNDDVDDNDDDGNIEEADEDVNETVLAGEETDEDEPTIEDVTAISRYEIEIEFSEYIDPASVDFSDFTLENVDLDENVDIFGYMLSEHDNVITLILDTDDALEGRYEYELTIGDVGVEDYAGNDFEEDNFTFDGSDLSQSGNAVDYNDSDINN